MTAWSKAVESRAQELARELCGADVGSDAQRESWREFLVCISPSVEHWIERSFVLRNYQLDSDDDCRAVFVLVVGRLHAKNFANLRKFLASVQSAGQGAANEDRLDADPVERGARIMEMTADGDGEYEADPAVELQGATPLRAWVITALRFAVGDHVRAKLGAISNVDKRGVSRRKINTESEALDAVPDPGERPPLTDWVALRRFFDEVEGVIDGFGDDERSALRAWLNGASFQEIADATNGSASDVRASIRATTARLRYRFRARRSELGVRA